METKRSAKVHFEQIFVRLLGVDYVYIYVFKWLRFMQFPKCNRTRHKKKKQYEPSKMHKHWSNPMFCSKSHAKKQYCVVIVIVVVVVLLFQIL